MKKSKAALLLGMAAALGSTSVDKDIMKDLEYKPKGSSGRRRPKYTPAEEKKIKARRKKNKAAKKARKNNRKKK